MKQRSDFSNGLDYAYYLEKEAPRLEKELTTLRAVMAQCPNCNRYFLVEALNKETLAKKATPSHITNETAQPRK